MSNAFRCVAFSVLFLSTIGRAEDSNTVTIKNFNFSPMQLSVSVGSTVTWHNADEEPHTVTSDTGAFRSGAIDGGGNYAFKFVKPGTYKYLCSIHPQMVATIVVK
ncbi:MAG TPA: cupredoxin family copper-binding protein [Rhizomicrobium sp.]|jgi:plastocyanin|nr:cupredoxin family copper-binding protein [Rhizomicrobium sp.]